MAAEPEAAVGPGQQGAELKSIFKRVMKPPGRKMLECFRLEFFINALVLNKHHLKRR